MGNKLTDIERKRIAKLNLYFIETLNGEITKRGFDLEKNHCSFSFAICAVGGAYSYSREAIDAVARYYRLKGWNCKMTHYGANARFEYAYSFMFTKITPFNPTSDLPF